MGKLVVCVVLLVNLLFTVVHCKPVEDSSGEKEAETVAIDYETMEPGDTYEKKPDMYIISASGSGEGDDYEDPSASYKVYCPPDFVEMWMKIFSTYPDKCMKEVNSEDESDASDQGENS